VILIHSFHCINLAVVYTYYYDIIAIDVVPIVFSDIILNIIYILFLIYPVDAATTVLSRGVRGGPANVLSARGVVFSGRFIIFFLRERKNKESYVDEHKRLI